MVLNRWVATHFWVADVYFWVAKAYVIVLLNQYMGRQIVNYSVLWVADYQTLRTTDQEKKLGQDSLSKAYIKKN